MEAKFIPIQRTATIPLEVVDFVVHVEPASAVLLTGTIKQFEVTFEPIGNFSQRLWLSVTNLPPGASGGFSHENPVAVTDVVTLTINAEGVAPGVYAPQIEAIPTE